MPNDPSTDIMTADKQTPVGPATVFELPASLDLTAAEPLHRALLQRIERDGGVQLDGHAVERVSTACLQVLLAAMQAAPFRIVAASAALDNAVRDLGLDGALGMETA